MAFTFHQHDRHEELLSHPEENRCSATQQGKKIACEKEATRSLELKLNFLLKSPPFWKQFPAFLIGVSEGRERGPCSRGIKPFKDALTNKAKIREHGSDVFSIKAFSFLSFLFFPPLWMF